MSKSELEDHIGKHLGFAKDANLWADTERDAIGCASPAPPPCKTRIVVRPETTSRHVNGNARKDPPDDDRKAIGDHGRIIALVTNMGSNKSVEFNLAPGASAFWVVEKRGNLVFSEFWQLGVPTPVAGPMRFQYCHKNLPYHPGSYASWSDIGCGKKGPPPLWTTCQAGCCYSNIGRREAAPNTAFRRKRPGS